MKSSQGSPRQIPAGGAQYPVMAPRIYRRNLRSIFWIYRPDPCPGHLLIPIGIGTPRAARPCLRPGPLVAARPRRLSACRANTRLIEDAASSSGRRPLPCYCHSSTVTYVWFISSGGNTAPAALRPLRPLCHRLLRVVRSSGAMRPRACRHPGGGFMFGGRILGTLS
jgi:hypothetical protein